ncbi:malto-oligosyltrehalose synthase [Amycolatopsis rhabdoformis]|uniref:Malto-oligosyltrehalose synthase n=1 Tax=Amycolatopsis rhabdoformis TaxID=1448059 RepID=A0ABZ1IHS0_9PSEU|nr:malto-oligosyltrehalose synthase [Amycolatopsis rhabdoformis]WSE33802.1 malto-oligosyltrehalose synthase [Amycolatopsis rhabdoformis]
MSAPSSTYRVQLRPEFTFTDAAAIVDYLRALGVGALYTSPVLDATTGSTHGYDVVDPTRARPELGGEQARKVLSARLKSAGLTLVVDIVPNHMSVEIPKLDRWWWDVLRHGQAAEHAGFFDIDWSRGKVLLPVLGEDAAAAELKVEGSGDDAELVYYDHRFPIAPGTGEGTPQEVHARQNYELVGWRRGNAELNYRRFFDITNLAAVMVEKPEVFAETHGEVLRWVSDGDVAGLRVDHPDGLADPGGYFRRLRAGAPDAWLVVEKILHPGEALPQSWPVEGTTGYDALNEITGVFVDPAAEPVFTRLADELGVRTDYAAVEEEARRLVTDRILVAEVHRIAALVEGLETGTEPGTATGTDAEAARAAVAEVMIAFGVYRSYLPEGAAEWTRAVERARSRRPDLGTAFDALDTQVRAEPQGELATRIQQTSGMVVAKGTEDTTFYRFTRFAALNEVGGDPARFGLSTEDFHRLAADRAAGRPASMTTLTTHDTKRSEDTRARQVALAELADEFADAVRRWTERCGIDEPALNLLAWQTLVGAWPIAPERLRDYLDKAAKESKLRTTWTDHDEAFERAVAEWPERVLADAGLVAEVEEFVGRLRTAGWVNSLGQKLVQLAGPGVPDVYQGTELWDFSLVDPDNRREVDYAARRAILDRVLAGEQPAVDETGAAKLLVVHRALTLRRERPELFAGYRPLKAEGAAAEHLLAFQRGENLAVAVTRLPVGLEKAGGWRDTVLPLTDGVWTDVLTGRALGDAPAAAALFDRYPVALLVRGDS